MDAELFDQSIKYERLTQEVYQAILRRDGNAVDVRHNTRIAGRSGVEHQIDVYWETVQASIGQKVLIECKNYTSNVTLHDVRSFFGVVHDVGNCVGVMVTKRGFQKGAADFSRHYGINMKLLRKPEGQDWLGRIKTIQVDVHAKMVVSTTERPIRASVYLEAASDEQEQRLKTQQANGTLQVPQGPDLLLRDSSGIAAEDELRWWLPRKLDVLEKDDGGPYTQRIPLTDRYIWVNQGTEREELVKVGGLVVEYYVETENLGEIIVDGDRTVEAILKDFDSGDIEHVRRSSDS